MGRACEGCAYCIGHVKGMRRTWEGHAKGMGRACEGHAYCMGHAKGMRRTWEGHAKGMGRACEGHAYCVGRDNLVEKMVVRNNSTGKYRLLGQDQERTHWRNDESSASI